MTAFTSLLLLTTLSIRHVLSLTVHLGVMSDVPETIAVSKMAVDIINANTHNSNTTLQVVDYLLQDTVDPVWTTLSFAGVSLPCCSNLTTDAWVIIGPFYSLQALPSAQTAQMFNLPQIGPTATNPALTSFHYYLRMISTDASEAQALAQLVYYYNWTAVNLFYTAEAYGQSISTWFTQAAEQFNISVVLLQALDTTGNNSLITSQVRTLQQSPCKVTILALNGLPLATPVFEALAAEGFIGPPYTYISTDGIASETISSSWLNIGEGMLGISGRIAKNTPQYMAFESAWQEYMNSTAEPPISDALTYDSVNAAALAIGEYLNDLENAMIATNASNITIDSQGTRGIKLREILTTRVSFRGVSGMVSFNQNGDRQNFDWVILNGVNSTWREVGLGFTGNNTLEILQTAYWPDGTTTVPKAIADVQYVQLDVTVSSPAYQVMIALISLLAVFGITLIYFFIHYTNNPVIRLSSPHLNIVIIIGCFLVLTIPLTFPLQTTQSCSALIWQFSLAGTLVFGTLAGKLYRVAKFFNNPGMEIIIIKDKSILLRVAILLGIDTVFLLALTLWFPAQTQNKIFNTIQHGWTSSTIYQARVCTWLSNPGSLVLLVVIFVFKIALLATTLYFAYQGRNAYVKQMNDFAETGMIAYSVLVLIGLYFILYLLNFSLFTAYIIASVFVFIFFVSTLSLLFIPKLIRMRNPKAQMIMSPDQPQRIGMTQDALFTSLLLSQNEAPTVLNQQITQLRDENQQLRKALSVSGPSLSLNQSSSQLLHPPSRSKSVAPGSDSDIRRS
jgi:ABC-type branched-subunit amino acid transport system substrate-binding protein